MTGNEITWFIINTNPNSNPKWKNTDFVYFHQLQFN